MFTNLLQSKKYFNRTLDEKLRQTLSSAEVNQGYTPDGAEANGGTDHKEVGFCCFDFDTSLRNKHSAMNIEDSQTISVPQTRNLQALESLWTRSMRLVSLFNFGYYRCKFEFSWKTRNVLVNCSNARSYFNFRTKQVLTSSRNATHSRSKF